MHLLINFPIAISVVIRDLLNWFQGIIHTLVRLRVRAATRTERNCDNE